MDAARSPWFPRWRHSRRHQQRRRALHLNVHHDAAQGLHPGAPAARLRAATLRRTDRGANPIPFASSSLSCLRAATAQVFHKIRAHVSLRRDPRGATGPPRGTRGSVSRRRRARRPVRPVRRAVMSRRAVPPGGTPPPGGGPPGLPSRRNRHAALHRVPPLLTRNGGRPPWTRIAFRARPTRRKVP